MSSSKSSKESAKRKNAPGNRSDAGWEHGIDVNNNGKRVKCKYCEKIVAGGIYRFKNHLACTHKDVEPCTSVPDDVKKQMMTLLAKTVEVKERKRKQIYGIEESEDDDEVEQVPS